MLFRKDLDERRSSEATSADLSFTSSRRGARLFPDLPSRRHETTDGFIDRFSSQKVEKPSHQAHLVPLEDQRLQHCCLFD